MQVDVPATQAPSQPVLLLMGTRWPVHDSFRAWDRDIVVKQHPGEEIGGHEVKTGLTVWDSVRERL